MAVILVVAVFLFPFTYTYAAPTVVVTTEEGPVEGINSSSPEYPRGGAFFGIPYVAAPTGSQRFRPPKPHAKWDHFDATNVTVAECLQLADGGVLDLNATSNYNFHRGDPNFMSEDCLFLHVQSPDVSPEKLLPVMAYIHGGSYLGGKGLMNATQIVIRGIVHVAFNYRLGVLGALCVPELLEESGTCGNLALQDQRMAMQWIQRNIHNFGGDPKQVTLAGESAGAMSVAAHLGLTRSESLFSRAIMMSGNDDSLALSEAYDAGARYLALVGCAGKAAVLGCLRNASAVLLLVSQTPVFNQSMKAMQMPVADGFELPMNDTLAGRFERAEPPAKPLLAGTNADDISIFFIGTWQQVSHGVSAADIATSIDRFYPNLPAADRLQMLDMYSPANFGGDPYKALFQLGTDGYFACPTSRVLDAMASSEASVYRYLFSLDAHSYAALWAGFLGYLPNVAGDPKAPSAIYSQVMEPFFRRVDPFKYTGAYHGLNEVVFWGWDTSAGTWPSYEVELGRGMNDQWSDFIHGRSPWSPYGSRKQYKVLNATHASNAIQSGYHEDTCTLLRKHRFIWDPMTYNGAPMKQASPMIGGLPTNLGTTPVYV